MGRVLTNNFSLAFAVQVAFDDFTTAVGDWKLLEPNTPNTFGADITTVARNPISKNRQARKGTITDLDASIEFEADLTRDSFIDFIEGFAFATAANADTVFPPRPGNRATNEGDTTATPGYTIPAATAAQAAKFQYTAGGPISLVHARGYANTANNSPSTVKELSADLASTDTVLQVAGLTVETAPTNAEVELAGIRAEAGDLALSVSSNIGTLSSGNNAATNNIDFTTLGLTIGQKIHVGGLTATNRFGSTAGGSNDSFGSARIRTIAAGSITLDKLDTTLTASDGTDTGSGGSNVQVDLLFGRFIRNVPTDDGDYAILTRQFEGTYPNLFETEPPTPVANPDGFIYVTAAQANELTFNFPLNGLANVNAAFVARDAEAAVDNGSRKTGAASPRLPIKTTAFNTASDFFRLGINDVDDTGLTSDFRDTTVTIAHAVTPENVLGTLGARYVNKGNFVLSLTSEALFNNANVTARIRANTTVTADWLLRNDDGAIACDVPSATLGDGTPQYPANETVRIALALNAFVDSLFQSSFSISLFAVYPAS